MPFHVAPNDMASIFFSSSTERESKNGVVLTHKVRGENITFETKITKTSYRTYYQIFVSKKKTYCSSEFLLMQITFLASYLLVIPPQQRVTTNDRLMLNLPIGKITKKKLCKKKTTNSPFADNVFGHTLMTVVTLLGGSIAFAPEVNDTDTIDVSTSLSVIAKEKPTILASGSGFLNQVKQLIDSRYGQSFLFKRGYAIKKEYLDESRLVNDCKYDMMVFRDIRQSLFGGNLRLICIDNGKKNQLIHVCFFFLTLLKKIDDMTDATLATFLRIVLSTQVLQTFNLPETSASVTVSMFYDYNAVPEAKGAPLPCNEIKLIDVAERLLTCEDKPNPRGEIWVRGNNVFKGYYKDSVATSDVLDADGWFMTGYLGEVLPNGTLKVIGRK